MSTLTPVLGLYKPDIYGDDNVWGEQLNANTDTLDSVVGNLLANGGGGGTGGTADLSHCLLDDFAIDGGSGGGSGGGIGEAPNDANSYGRHALGWSAVLPLTGGALAGDLTVNGKLIVGNSESISTNGIVLARTVTSFRADSTNGTGGTVYSWETTANVGFGFTLTNAAVTPTTWFGPVNPASGTLTAISMYVAANGDFGVSSPTGNAAKPGGGPWVASSDARIKTVLGDYEHGLEELLALRPIRYHFNDSFGGTFPPVVATSDDPPPATNILAGAIEAKTEFIGLIAQEAETVMPEMVTQTYGIIDGVPVDDLRVLDTTALTFALVNAVKELSGQVEALRGRVQTLEGAAP
jgi:hypothetical protein